MFNLNSKQWFTEIFTQEGSAFSLKISEILHEEQTPFQKIVIYATERFGNLMVIDGCTMLSSRDNFLYHEMMAHPPLFTHADPREVAIIGGGDCGTLKEVLKHSETIKVTQIEIDEAVTRLALRFFPELTEFNNDPRVSLLFEDGIKWIQNTPANSLDLIIIDSTDPVGPATGLFTSEFYNNCWQVLKSDGILIQQSESPLYHAELLKQMHNSLRAVGFNYTHTLCFPQPIYPSGWWSATMASKKYDLTQFRIKDVNKKIFNTRYYNAAIHQAALAQPEFLKLILNY